VASLERKMITQRKCLKDLGSLELSESPFLRACHLLKTSSTPIWLMRQAGRFLPEYRKIRSKLGFLELCKSADLSAQLTVTACEKLGVDAAIIFADILLILEPMGVGLEFTEDNGPIIHTPIRASRDLKHIQPVSPESELTFVYEAIRLARAYLNPNIPLIGFAGAPFTLASYLIEGGSSRHFARTKQFMYCQTEDFRQLMSMLSEITVSYLRGQVKAGAQVLQLFDSWVGCLSCDDYEVHVLPHVRKIIADLGGNEPIIYFGTGTAALLPLIRQANPHVLGLDFRVDLACEWSKLGYDVAVQGNLDPAILLAGKEEIIGSVKKILSKANSRPGHIFNLGHGVLPQTPVGNVQFLVETVHQLSAK